MGKNSGKKHAKQSAAETVAANGAPLLKLDKKEYESELFKLQVELVKMQGWVKETGRASSSSSRAGMRRERAA
jgi:polyphosphate kinase 2 (PPK2 family)